MAEYIDKEALCHWCLETGPSYCDQCVMNREGITAADVVPASVFRDCRNELCLKCGAYTQKHNGACDGCRWR